MPENEKVATALADKIGESGYLIASESGRNELRDAILQGDIQVMTTDLTKLNALNFALEYFLEQVLTSIDAMRISLFLAGTELQRVVQDAIDELNDELHLERIP